MRKSSFVLLTVIFTLGCGLFGSPEYESKEYISTARIAQPDQETKIELEDGAAIVIPASSIDDEVSVKVERNPEKSNNLPPLDEGVVKVGDFYNFEIDGTLNGSVDLILPFDPDSLPESKAGVLVVAIPTDNGWKYVPVVPDGNKVTLYTDEVGDPLIAWHFSCVKDRIDLGPSTYCDEREAKLLACDPDIALDVIQNGDKFQIVGSVIPVSKNFFGIELSEPAANINVTLNLNLREFGSGSKFSVQTDENGSFSYELDSTKLKEGWNWVFAKAECDPWWGQIAVESKGYAEFKYTPAVVQQPASTPTSQSSETPIATIIPAPVETPIPTGAVLLPDFVGKDIDDAIDWLTANGFKYTWIDGSSTYELGTVFKQSPFGGQYKVPHRTVVVLYRTTEQVEDIYGCNSNANLTQEEQTNCGIHTYQRTQELISEYTACGIADTAIRDYKVTFVGDEVSIICTTCQSSGSGVPMTSQVFRKSNENVYTERLEADGGYYLNMVTFNDSGFTWEISIEYYDKNYGLNGKGCKWRNTYTLN